MVWTQEDIRTLIEGILKYGEGNWKDIKKEYIELGKKFSSPTALKDKVVNLKKNNTYDNWITLVTTGQENVDRLDNLTETVKCKWSFHEEEVLKNAWYEFGDVKRVWKKIQEKYGEELKNHKKDTWRHKIVMMQKGQLKDVGGGQVEERLSKLLYKEKVFSGGSECSNVSFTCDCGVVHTWKSMLLSGIKCECDKSLSEMLGQVEANFRWVVYIILDENNKNGLSGKVAYVGYSKVVKSRLKSHEKVKVKDSNFNTLRINVLLSERQLVEMLRPEYNGINGSKCDCRIKVDNEWKNYELKNTGSKYDKILATDIVAGSRILDIDVHTSAGIISSRFERDQDISFCMLEGEEECKCTRKCIYRKIGNALQGRKIWYGLLEYQVKKELRVYKDVPRLQVNVSSVPVWSKEYVTSILDRNKEIKAISRDKYRGIIERSWESGVMSHFGNPLEVYNIMRCESDSVRESILVCFKSILSHMTNKELCLLFGSSYVSLRVEYHRLLVALRVNLNERRQQLSNWESKNWALLSEVESSVESMRVECKDIYEYQRVVWYKMELYQGCVRNEYNSLKVLNYVKDVDNYVDIEEGVIVLNEYKTSNAHGKQVFKIEDRVKEDLYRLYKYRMGKSEEYLFMNRKGSRLSGSNFSACMMNGLEKYIGKRIGSRQLRKMTITESLGVEVGIHNKEDLARRMLHTVGMQQEYRRIV